MQKPLENDRARLIREAATLVAQTETPSLDVGMLAHCALQHRYADAMFPARGALRADAPFKGHYYYSAADARTSYLNVQTAYKGTLFTAMNKFIYQRAMHPDADPNPACYDESGCQLLLDQTYVLLQGILDLPRYNKEFTVYRLLGREIGAGGYANRPEEFVRRYYSPGSVYPNYKFLSTGLLVGAGLDGQVGLKITVPANFPALFYFSTCWSRDANASQSGSAILEGSEVLLPYTTDPTGESLTWGLKIERVDSDKVYGSSSDGLQQWKAKILIHCRIVPLQQPIPLQKVEQSAIFGLYDEKFKYMNENDIFGNERLQTLQRIYERKLPAQTLQRFGIDQTTIENLVDDGYDDFEAISMLEEQEIDQYTKNDSERKLMRGYVKLFQYLDREQSALLSNK